MRVRAEDGKQKLIAERKAAVAAAELQREKLKEVITKFKELHGEVKTFKDGRFRNLTERETSRVDAELQAKMAQLDEVLTKAARDSAKEDKFDKIMKMTIGVATSGL